MVAMYPPQQVQSFTTSHEADLNLNPYSNQPVEQVK